MNTRNVATIARRGRLAGAFLLLLVETLIGAGCHTRPVGGTSPTELRIGLGTGASVRNVAIEGIGSLLFSESLLTREWDGRASAGLVTGWRWEDSGRALHLQLKDGIYFHDNSILTAAVLVDTLNRTLASADRPLGFTRITEVKNAGDRTVVITLSEPDFFLVPALTHLKMVRLDAPDVATGPFRIVRRSPVFEAERFDRYHGGKPAMARVRIMTYETPRAAWAALLRGDVDALQEVTQEIVDFASQSPNARTYAAVQSFYISLLFNQRQPLLARLEVRRALNEAIDRDSIVRAAMRGHGQVAENPIWPNHWAYTPPSQPHRYDPQSARRRLDTAGLPVRPGAPAGRTPSRFSIRCLFWNENPQYERMALLIQRQLFEIGVDLQLEPATAREIEERAATGDFEALLMRANAGRSLDYTYRFWRSSPPGVRAMARSGYTGADALLDRLRLSTADDEARAAVAALARKFQEDVPAAFIAWPQVTRAIDARFEVGTGNGQDPFANIWHWRPVPAGHQ